VFSQLPQVNSSAILKDKKEQFLETLPAKFTLQEFIDVARSIFIQERTYFNYYR
jgi:hypothetical protein